MSTDIRKMIKELVKIKLDQGLIMSLYLDLSPDAKGQRHYPTFLKKKFTELEKRYPPRTAVHENIILNLAEINRYLQEKLESRTKGLALFISQSKGHFSALQTALPFENRLVVSRLPYIYPLVRMADDYAPFGIILSDEKRARLLRVDLGQIEEEMEILSDVEAVSSKGYQTKKEKLGHSDERYQRHFKEQVAKHTKMVIAKALKFFPPGTADVVLLMVENGVLAEFQRQMPGPLRPLAQYVESLEVRTPREKVLAKALNFFHRMEEEASLKAANEVVVWGTGRGGRAVVGTEATLEALQNGQAELLVINDKYSGEGWRCENCLRMGSGGQVKACPYCRSVEVNLAPDMKEEMVELAMRRGARVEFYRGNSDLNKYGGVGALLRSR